MNLLLALCLLTGARFVPPRLRPIQATPSVVVVVLDDVAAADLALYGGPVQTPYLAQLAAAGIQFTNAYSDAWCAPTRRSLTFGRWAQNQNGAACSDFPAANTPAGSLTSLAEALPSHASAWLGKWHLGGIPGGGDFEEAPIFHGFDYWIAGLPSNLAQPVCAPSTPSYLRWRRYDADSLGFTATLVTSYQPLVLRDAFISGWPSAPSPALAVVAPQLAHAPLHAPLTTLLPLNYPTPTTDRELYEAMLVALDKTVGQMLAHVDLEETLVIVIGDNGTPEAVAPVSTKAKNSCYERGVKVPLIVAGGPTVNPGRLSDALVHAVDVYATVIEAGGGTPTGDGHSFLPVIEQQTFTERTTLFLGERWLDAATAPCSRAAVSSSGFKLIQWDTDANGTVDSEELFDLSADPSEATNILTSSTEDDALRAWLAAHAP